MDKVRENINNFILEMYEKYRPIDQNILEIGVGNLDENKKLFSPGNRYVGTDSYKSEFADLTLDIAQKREIGEFRGADFIIMSEVLEHVFDHQSALANCREILKKGGLLLITIPWEYPEHGEDYWRYSERTIDRLLSQHRFEVIESKQGWDGEKKTNIFRLAKKS